MKKQKDIVPETESSQQPKSPAAIGASGDESGIASEKQSSDPVGGSEHTFNLLPDDHEVKPKGVDLEKIRVSQDFDAMADVLKVVTVVPVNRPSKQTFFRIHPDESWTLTTYIIQFEQEQETYIIVPEVAPHAHQVAAKKVIYTGITRSGDLFLCPVALPDSSGKWNQWHRSLMAAMEQAKHKWIKIVSNRAGGKYETFVAEGDIPDPEWPDDVTFNDLITIAFEDRIIDSPNHPVLLKLKGKI